MKSLIYSLIVGLSLLATAPQAEYLEGIEYVELASPQPVTTGDKIEVREIFLYTCPHCFHLEPVLDKWLKTKPANAALVRTPAIFRPTLEPHARAFYAFEALGILEKMHYPFFKAIHTDHRALNDEASITKFVAEQGVDQKEFRRAYRSFSTDAQVKQSHKLQAAYGVDSVPTLIVDGKYRTNASMVGGNQAMMELVDYLIKKSAAERKAGKKPAK